MEDSGNQSQREERSLTHAERFAITKYQLQRWCELSIALWGCFVLLILNAWVSTPLMLAVLPSLLLDVWIASQCAFRLRQRPEYSLCRSALAHARMLDLIESSGSSLFKILAISAWTTHAFSLFIALVPWVIGLCLRQCMSSRLPHECYSFTSIVRFPQVGCCCRWTRLFTLICIILKLEGYVDWNWLSVASPLWVALAFLSLLSIGVLILAASAFAAYLTGEVTDQEVSCSFWLLYAVCGSLVSFGYLCFEVFQQEQKPKTGAVMSLVFLTGFITVTYIGFNRLSCWWTTFFNPETHELAPQINGAVRPIMVRPSIPAQIRTVLKTSPRLLMRLSSSYFQPAHVLTSSDLTIDSSSITNRRTISNYQNSTQCLDDTSCHRKCQSSVVSSFIGSEVQLIRKPSNYKYTGDNYSEKVCDMCCEERSNAVIMECGHSGICYECSLVLWNTTGACHMCRSPISQVLQIQVEPCCIVKVISITRAANEGNSSG